MSLFVFFFVSFGVCVVCCVSLVAWCLLYVCCLLIGVLVFVARCEVFVVACCLLFVVAVCRLLMDFVCGCRLFVVVYMFVR